MSVRFIIPIILFIPLAIIQLSVIPLISVDYIAPDLILILIVFFTLRNGQIYGSILGAFLGLLFDLVSGGLIGGAMFSKTLAGFIAGYFYNEKNVESYLKSFTFIFIVMLCSTIDSIAYSLLASSELNITLLNIVFDFGIFPGIYSSIIALPVIIFKPGNKLL